MASKCDRNGVSILSRGATMLKFFAAILTIFGVTAVQSEELSNKLGSSPFPTSLIAFTWSHNFNTEWTKVNCSISAEIPRDADSQLKNTSIFVWEDTPGAPLKITYADPDGHLRPGSTIYSLGLYDSCTIEVNSGAPNGPAGEANLNSYYQSEAAWQSISDHGADIVLTPDFSADRITFIRRMVSRAEGFRGQVIYILERDNESSAFIFITPAATPQTIPGTFRLRSCTPPPFRKDCR